MTEWKYLNSVAFKTRYVVAASFLTGCKRIVEIGSYKTPIYDFMDDTFREFVIYEIKDGVPFEKCPGIKDYGLVILGLDLESVDESEVWKLVENSRVAVLETAVEYFNGRTQLERVLLNTSKKVVFRCVFDFEGNDYGDLTGSAVLLVKRLMVVLE